MTTYYKVLRREYDELISVSTSSWTCADSVRRVVYEPFKKTVPILPGSKLFVFKDLVDARMFVADRARRDNIEIWEAVVTNPVRLQYRSCLTDGNVKDFWATRANLVKRHISTRNLQALLNAFLVAVPQGTYGVNSVRLIAPVPKENYGH